jgi:dihydrolipoamide dehydrogenase
MQSMIQFRRLISERSSVLGRALSSPASQYDVVIVGGGPGGYVAAIKASQLGLKTACIEGRGKLGGTCLNIGCIPSKALLHSSQMYDHAKKDFSEHGVIINGSISVDITKMMENKTKAINGLTGGIEYLFKKYKVDYVKGWGKLSGPNSVSVSLADGGSTVVESKNIILAVGSEVRVSVRVRVRVGVRVKVRFKVRGKVRVGNSNPNSNPNTNLNPNHNPKQGNSFSHMSSR